MICILSVTFGCFYIRANVAGLGLLRRDASICNVAGNP